MEELILHLLWNGSLSTSAHPLNGPTGVYKMNTDASVVPRMSSASLRGVIGDHPDDCRRGNLPFLSSFRHEVEHLSIKLGLESVLNDNISNLCVESYCLAVVQ